MNNKLRGCEVAGLEAGTRPNVERDVRAPWFGFHRICAIGVSIVGMVFSAQAYVIHKSPVPMSDGVKLQTYVYLPQSHAEHPCPTILVRSSYGINWIHGFLGETGIFDIACDGLRFAVVLQSTRGSEESEGRNEVFLTDGWLEKRDGYDTVDWIARQEWSNGEVGLLGGSALGITAYLAMGTLHPAIKTAHVGVAPWSFYEMVYPGGQFRESQVTNWLRGQKALYMLPIYMDHPFSETFWPDLDMRTRADRIDIPVHHWGGWHDVFAEGPPAAFHNLQECQRKNGVRAPGLQRLTMGPWTHEHQGPSGQTQGDLVYPVNSMLGLWQSAGPIRWFMRHLRGVKVGQGEPTWPVCYYLMGPANTARITSTTSPGRLESPDRTAPGLGNVWEQSLTWPVPATEQKLYLQTDGRLAARPTKAHAGALSYRYDPEDPCPTIGGREMMVIAAGPRDLRPLHARHDVLVFQTEPLARPLKVVGPVKAVLYVSSSAADTDFTVRLADVYPDGRAMLVADGIMRTRYRKGYTSNEVSFLNAADTVELTVDLHDTAQLFGIGHRIQVLVSSANYPRFSAGRNNTAVRCNEGPSIVATNTLHMNALHPSHLVLPEPLAGAVRSWQPPLPPPVSAVASARKKLAAGRTLDAPDIEALVWEADRILFSLCNGIRDGGCRQDYE